ncbi:zinc finger CCCH domain-containing protein 19 [Tanacetum coccineum]
MGKKLDDDVEKDIEDCSNNVTEKCGVVNNNMSNNVEGEILEDHFDGDCGNNTIEDNADVNPSTNVSLKVNIPEVANDSSIVSPSTPPGNDLNIAKESCSTWLDYVGPLITDELDSEKRWSYRDPKGNIQGSFSLAQLHMWKDYFPSDLQIWSYYDNGNMPAARLTPDDNEARSELFDEQKREIERNKKEVDNIKEEMRKFKEEMNVQSVRQENKEPIIVDQHYGLRDFTQFQSTHGGPSSFQGHVNSSYFNMGTPSNFQTPMQS